MFIHMLVHSLILGIQFCRKFAYCFSYLQKVNEKPQVINDYEAGRGIPNQLVIGKIEKAIGKYRSTGFLFFSSLPLN